MDRCDVVDLRSLGIEKVRIVPGITASNALDLYYMPYTHSLLGVLCWSALAYVVCQMVPAFAVRTGLILAVLRLSFLTGFSI